MVGPRIFHTGNVIYGAGAPGYHNDVADLDDAYSALIRIKAEGGPASFSYKNYNQYSRLVFSFLLLYLAQQDSTKGLLGNDYFLLHRTYPCYAFRRE